MKKVLLSCLLGFLVGACGGSEDETVPPDGPEVPSGQTQAIRFSSNINPMSRATDTGFETSDAIGVYAFKTADGFNDNGYAKNVKYTYDGTYFTSGSGIKYPSESEGLAFFALYPYNTSASSQFNFSVQSDQSKSRNYTQSDLMTASTGVTKVETPNLTFDHRLSNIIVNIEYAQAPLSGATISFSAKQSASVNLITNTYSATGNNPVSIVAAPNGTNSFKIILPPQTIAKGTKFANLIINDVNYVWTLNENIVLKSGMQYKYNLTVDNETKTISFTGSINPWGTDTRPIENVIPQNIIDKMEPYITIYKGTTPPNVEGTYFIDPMTTVYCEDQGNGGYNPGELVNSHYIKFASQDNTYLTLDFEEKSATGTSSGVGNGAFISGSGTNFTAYFDTEGSSSGIYTKTALVISGTKTSSGIQNLKYAFVMVDKGSDPKELLMNVGVFRVFKDQDGLARNASWNSTRAIIDNLSLPDYISNNK